MTRGRHADHRVPASKWILYGKENKAGGDQVTEFAVHRAEKPAPQHVGDESRKPCATRGSIKDGSRRLPMGVLRSAE